MNKDKLFIVSSNLDDSIKSVTPVYDIKLFNSFTDLENFVENTPMVVDTIMINETDLPFTNTNMARLITVLKQPFLKLSNKCVYLVKSTTNTDSIDIFLRDNNIDNVIYYRGDLTTEFIASIITGVLRQGDEEQTEIVTYRVRAAEYAQSQSIKRYNSDNGYYETDEENLADIPDIPEPVVKVPEINTRVTAYYIVGKQSYERTLFAFITAQYTALNSRTIIIESDISYHRLSDMVLRTMLPHSFYEISDLLDNPMKMFATIKDDDSRLIVIGSTQRIVYDYKFIYDLVFSNLQGSIDVFIKECEYVDTPYGQSYTIVCKDTVPDILECCESLAYDPSDSDVTIVGVRNGERMECDVTSIEMLEICKQVLGVPDIKAQVIAINGLQLNGGNYDFSSIIGRGNTRQD